MKFVFLVLHYKTSLVTERCVNSILKYEKAKIIIIDNGSNDGSGEFLMEKYKNTKNVFVLISNKNLGFSDGNNYAFEYINDEKIDYDFIICCNNDLVFEQKDFLDILIDVYNDNKVPVIGPDILMYKDKNIHQNPLRFCARNISEIEEYKKEINNNIKNINYLSLKLRLKKILSVFLKDKTRNSLDNFDYTIEKKGVCLSGSCLIFTPTFFTSYKKLFFPSTFFYHEEEILYYRLSNKGLEMLYTPKLQVLHDHSVSTNKSFSSEKEKLLFKYRNNLKGCNILLDYINGDKNEE